MAKYAVLMRYEVTSGLVVEANNEDEAIEIAQQFEERVHDGAVDADGIKVSARIWGGGSADVEVAVDEDDAEDLIDEWIDELESDEDDFEDYDEDEDEDEEESEADGREDRHSEEDLDPDDDADEYDENNK
ncbi:hypothetical protein [Gulosibacter molinativorax]|uniref:DNA primase n=1 Tax=Gulosibacter molinativorax TaxID=256821 RepID=A0ABT7C609_9MICO|nr:hypothetical protein [Gulosibacter molinativorax]MDJ1370623.1 hypothetical protein [Gulosibacter molinativorax]QUY61963.1 Hypotetical protein [Gulosibacter molinativorax]